MLYMVHEPESGPPELWLVLNEQDAAAVRPPEPRSLHAFIGPEKLADALERGSADIAALIATQGLWTRVMMVEGAETNEDLAASLNELLGQRRIRIQNLGVKCAETLAALAIVRAEARRYGVRRPPDVPMRYYEIGSMMGLLRRRGALSQHQIRLIGHALNQQPDEVVAAIWPEEGHRDG